jgi:hypothetical protein
MNERESEIRGAAMVEDFEAKIWVVTRKTLVLEDTVSMIFSKFGRITYPPRGDGIANKA